MQEPLGEGQRQTTRFAEIVLGVEVTEDPPPPDSIAGQLEALAERKRRGELTEDEFMRLAREI